MTYKNAFTKITLCYGFFIAIGVTYHDSSAVTVDEFLAKACHDYKVEYQEKRSPI